MCWYINVPFVMAVWSCFLCSLICFIASLVFLSLHNNWKISVHHIQQRLINLNYPEWSNRSIINSRRHTCPPVRTTYEQLTIGYCTTVPLSGQNEKHMIRVIDTQMERNHSNECGVDLCFLCKWKCVSHTVYLKYNT